MFFSINRSEGLCVYFTKYWCSALFGRILLDFFFGKKGPEGRRFLESTAAEEVVGESSDHCFRCSTFLFSESLDGVEWGKTQKRLILGPKSDVFAEGRSFFLPGSPEAFKNCPMSIRGPFAEQKQRRLSTQILF